MECSAFLRANASEWSDNMRNLFSKSLSVVVINIYTALFLTIALSSLVHAYHQTYQYADGLKGDYLSISINENEGVGNFYKDFCLYIDSTYSEKNTLILRYNDTGNCGVYYSGKNFADLDILSGRNFELNDFKNNRNVALVSENMKEKCIDIDGTTMIQIGSGYYEVVGYFDYKEGNTINQGSYVYYNLFSNNMFKDESTNIGQIVIDNNVTGEEILNQLKEKYPTAKATYPTKISFTQRLTLALFSQSITIMPLCLVMIAVILNSINITINWVNNNKKELVVRRICGANMKNLTFLLIRKYFILTSISYVVGFVAAYLISKVNYSLFIGFDFSIITILISYLATMAMCVISILIMLTFGNIESVTALRGN